MVASVADLCEQKKISAADLARQSASTRPRDGHHHGALDPSPAERQKIASAFNLTIDKLPGDTRPGSAFVWTRAGRAAS